MAEELPLPSDSDILAHDAWVRRVVRRMVKDPQLADDLAQEAHEAGLKRGGAGVKETKAWFGGVVRNRLKQHLRSRERRERAEAGADRPRTSPAASELVARAEVLQIVGRAVLDLPEPYRSVLLLRFHEDWPQRRIAAAHGVSAKTVDNQIQAGLRMLRPRLEQRLGDQWLAALLPVAYPLAAGSGLLLPLATMSKPVLTATTLALAAGLLLLIKTLLSPSPGTSEDLHAAAEAASATTTAEAPGTRVGETPIAEPDSTTVTRTDVPVSGTAGRGTSKDVVIRGRCVAEESGRPLQGVLVNFYYYAPQPGPLGMREGTDWVPPEPMETGADGQFEFRLVEPPEKGDYSIVIETPGRIMRRANWGSRPTGAWIESTDFGEVPLQAGTTLFGTVLDEEGNPVQGARLSSAEIPGQSLTDPEGGVWASAQTAEDGRFEFENALPSGPQKLRMRARGYLLIGPHAVDVEKGAARQEVQFRVKAMPSVRGVVRSTDGSAVAKASVIAKLAGGGWTARGVSDEEGRFEVFDTRDVQQDFTLEVTGRGFQKLQTEQTFTWGDRDILLTVSPTRSLEIVVVDAQSGAAVEEYAVATRTVGDPVSTSNRGEARLGGVHPEGRLTVDDLVDGPSHLLVIPHSEDYAVAGPLVVDPDDPMGGGLRVELARTRELRARVQLADGTPVEGSTVQVVERFPRFGRDRLVDFRQEAHRLPTGFSLVQAYATEVSAADGLATLHVPADLETAHFLVSGSHPDLQETAEVPGDESEVIPIVVAAQARVTGTLQRPPGEWKEMGLYFKRLDTTRGFGGVPREGLATMEENGRFEMAMDPGRYAIHFVRLPPRNPEGPQVTFGSGWAVHGEALLERPFEAGDPVELKLDASSYVLGSIEGVLRVNGEVQATAALRFGSSNGPFRALRTDADGHYRFEDLPAGEYQFRYRGPDAHQWPAELVLPDSVQVLAGKHTIADADFSVRSLRIRVLDAQSDEPYADVEVQVLSAGGRVNARTDSDGWFTLEQANSGRVGIHFEIEGVPMMAHPVEVPADPEVTTLEVHARPR